MNVARASRSSKVEADLRACMTPPPKPARLVLAEQNLRVARADLAASRELEIEAAMADRQGGRPAPSAATKAAARNVSASETRVRLEQKSLNEEQKAFSRTLTEVVSPGVSLLLKEASVLIEELDHVVGLGMDTANFAAMNGLEVPRQLANLPHAGDLIRQLRMALSR